MSAISAAGGESNIEAQALFRATCCGSATWSFGARAAGWAEWVGHAPALEEGRTWVWPMSRSIWSASAPVAADSHAGEVEGRGRSEDDIAYLREHREYLNATLVEQPNGDFGQTIVRQVLIDAFQLELYERMTASTDERLAAIAAKIRQEEARYHLRYRRGLAHAPRRWYPEEEVMLESRSRTLEKLWPYTVELFAEDELDRSMAERGVAPRLSDVYAAWSAHIDGILAEATLERPADRPHSWHGKRGSQHSEQHLGHLLAEMQHLQRTYPGCTLVNLVFPPPPPLLTESRIDAAWEALRRVEDPEIPAVSIVELGLIRYVKSTPTGSLDVGLSPTYVGCPATEVIRQSVREALANA